MFDDDNFHTTWDCLISKPCTLGSCPSIFLVSGSGMKNSGSLFFARPSVPPVSPPSVVCPITIKGTLDRNKSGFVNELPGYILLAVCTLDYWAGWTQYNQEVTSHNLTIICLARLKASERAGWMEDGRPRPPQHCCSVLMRRRRRMPHSSILSLYPWLDGWLLWPQRDHLIRGRISI